MWILKSKELFLSAEAQRKRITASYKRKKTKNLLLLPLKSSNTSNSVKREDFSKFYLSKGFWCIWKKCSNATNHSSKYSNLTPLITVFTLQRNPSKLQLNKQTKNSFLRNQCRDTNLVINCILTVFCIINWLSY